MSNYREQFGSLPSQFKTGGGYIPWAHQEVRIAGNTLATIHFDSTKPNMFMLQNPNSTVIHVGISRIPTATNYEFKIEANSSATFGRPSQTDVVYLLNKGNTDVVVSLFSINDKFDMAILQSLNVDLSKSPVFDGIINGFGVGTSLPSGNNKIGSVEVSKMPTVEIKNLETKMDEIKSHISHKLSSLVSKTYTEQNEVNDTYNGYNYLHFFSNDGSSDITLTLNNTIEIIVKAGEVINDLAFDISKVSIAGSNFSCRYLLGVR